MIEDLFNGWGAIGLIVRGVGQTCRWIIVTKIIGQHKRFDDFAVYKGKTETFDGRNLTYNTLVGGGILLMVIVGCVKFF